MASVSTLSNEEAVSEDKTDMPVLQEMINDLRESTDSLTQTSYTSSSAEDLLINQVILLPQLSENDETTGEICTDNDVDIAKENKSETIAGALNSFSQRISIELNSATSSTTDEPEEQSTNPSTVEQASTQPVDNISPCPTLPSVQPTAIIGSPTKKQHIMISYNRSCEDTCRKIRNNLKGLKYKVWMDVYDMHDNFIEGMAKAIRNSYIVLMCINSKYDDSFWCKKEAEDIAIKRIKFIPCFMEEPFPLEDWLDFLVGGNIWIDFSKEDKFDKSFEDLIKEITFVEEKLATNPRETPPTTPMINLSNAILSNPTVTKFDNIMRNFKTWIEENRHDLKRFNRKQSVQLINQLIHELESDNGTPDDENKKELLQQLLSATSRNQNELLPRFVNSLNTSNYLMMKGLLVIMALWAVRVVFKK